MYGCMVLYNCRFYRVQAQSDKSDKSDRSDRSIRVSYARFLNFKTVSSTVKPQPA